VHQRGLDAVPTHSGPQGHYCNPHQRHTARLNGPEGRLKHAELDTRYLSDPGRRPQNGFKLIGRPRLSIIHCPTQVPATKMHKALLAISTQRHAPSLPRALRTVLIRAFKVLWLCDCGDVISEKVLVTCHNLCITN
jgi:hypothetical protein